MKAIFSLLLTLPGLAQANLCMESASPVIKQFQAQKTWVQETVQDPNVALKLEGFVDAYNQFYPEGFSQRVSQKAELLLDPKNENNKMFKSFCSQYEDRGPYLTSARVAQAMNNYELKVQLLPNAPQYSNNPYESLKTHRFNAQIEIDPDSLIGRLPRIHELT